MPTKYLIIAAVIGGFLLLSHGIAYVKGRTDEQVKWENKTLKQENKAIENDVEIEKKQKKVVPLDARALRECLRRSCA